jgi:predicted CopG family antitoxin
MSETTIQISRETREKLKKIGSKGQTYDEVIQKLMEIAQKVAFFKELDRISDHEEFIPLDHL